MLHPSDDHRAPINSVQGLYFEPLEDRLLLTTLMEGHNFYYQNSTGQTVRVSLTDSDLNTTAEVELFATRPDGIGGITNLVGFYDENPANVVTYSTGDPVTVLTTPAQPTWAARATPVLGAQTEIFAIYFAKYSKSTLLTITTLTSAQLFTNPGAAIPWYDDINPWAGGVPILGANGTADVTAPTGSGGVIVGSVWTGGTNAERHQAVSNDSPVSVPATGVFPGGQLRPGITYSTANEIVHPGVLGTNVQAIAMRGDGNIYTVDSNNQFKAITIDQRTGNYQVRGESLSYDQLTKLFYIADNNIQLANPPTGVPMGNSYCFDFTGVLWEINNRQLFTITRDPATGVLGGPVAVPQSDTTALASGNQAFDAQFQVIGMTGLQWWSPDGTPPGSSLYAFAQVTKKPQYASQDPFPPTGWLLVQVDPNSGNVRTFKQIRGLPNNVAPKLLKFAPNDWKTGLVLGSDNKLYQLANFDKIDWTKPNWRDPTWADPAPSDWDDPTDIITVTGGTAITGIGGANITGLAFVHGNATDVGLFYAVTDTGSLYDVNLLTGVSTLVGTTGVGLNGLAYNSSFWSYPLPALMDGQLVTVVNGNMRLISLASQLYTDFNTPAQPNPAMLGQMYDSKSVARWRNVMTMDIRDSDRALFGIAQKFTSDDTDGTERNWYLISINKIAKIDQGTGATRIIVTQIGQLPVEMDAMAFNSKGELYGIGVDNHKYLIDPVTGSCTDEGALTGISGVTGMDFAVFGTKEVLYAVNKTDFYAIGDNNVAVDMGATGRTDMTAFKQEPGNQYGFLTLSTDPTQPQKLKLITRLQLAVANLVRYDTNITQTGANPVSIVGPVFDSVDQSLSYTDFRALDFDRTGVLYGVGKVANFDPTHNSGGSLATGAIWLLKIDPLTGKATRVIQLPMDMTTLAFDSKNVLYAVDANYNLVPIDVTDPNPLTNLLNTIGHIQVPIVGIEFIGNTLYGVTSNTLYVINTKTAWASSPMTIRTDAGPISGITGLTANPNDPNRLWVSYFDNGVYRVAEVPFAPAVRECGRVTVGGTIAGRMSVPGNMDLLQMGFLFGNVNVNGNLTTLIMRQGGGAVPITNGFVQPLSGSLVHVGGSAGNIITLGSTLYSSLEVANDPAVLLPSTAIRELEYSVDTTPAMSQAAINTLWLQGNLTDLDNDSMAHAQFLSSPTGNMTVTGSLANEAGVFTMTHMDPWLNTNGNGDVDWYALPLYAGQTVTIDGTVGVTTFRGTAMEVDVYDSHGNWVGTLGRETVEDDGIMSRGTTQKALTMTPRYADIYYLAVAGVHQGGTTYTLDITNGTEAALGGVNIGGDYTSRFHSAGGAADIATLNGGDIGGIAVQGISHSTIINSSGNIVAIADHQMGVLANNVYSQHNVIAAEGNIGRVSTIGSFMCTNISAGSAFNTNAFIQNISSDGDLVQNAVLTTKYFPLVGVGITATGSIGVMDVAGTLWHGMIFVNNDHVGTGGTIDQITVKGNWGGNTGNIGIPTLAHGPGGDIGYVYVGGTIFTSVDGWIESAPENSVSDGHTTILNDDGGGQLTVSVTGQPTNPPTWDNNGKQIINYPTYSWAYIPVDDVTGGIGGVIANFRTNGTTTIAVQGTVQIGRFDLTGVKTTDKVILKGGDLGVYFVQDAGADALNTLQNTGDGDLISGSLAGSGGVTTITWHGSIGMEEGNTGAWVHGPNAAAAVADPVHEPQYGHYYGTVNGLEILGNLGALNLDGSLGDLRVTGTIGAIVVNADKSNSEGEYDGVVGLVWSQGQFGSIDVGDGLADDGSSDTAEAGIMSSASIGTVTISGPRYVMDGIVYGELNGAILASGPGGTITTTDKWGQTVNTPVDAIGSILGTNGAHLTAIVAAGGLDCFESYKTTPFVHSGGVSLVDFSGTGAQINGSEIFGLFVRHVIAESGTLGIVNSYIGADRPRANQPGVELVEAGGPGFDGLHVQVSGGSVGTVRGIGSVADAIRCTFTSTDGMVSLSARDLMLDGFYMPGTLQQVTVTRDASFNTANIGAIKNFNVTRDFGYNTFTIAGELTAMTVGRDFLNSSLILQGPTTANLKSLQVTGNISGVITSYGRIGSITAGGYISADISTVAGGWNNDVNLIQAAKGYTGTLEVAGSLNSFICGVSLGKDPTKYSSLQEFNIQGDLGNLQVGSSGSSSHLYAAINVGGDAGTWTIYGSLCSTVNINGNLNSLTLSGGLGSKLSNNKDYGKLTVMGGITTLKFNTAANLVADLTVGDSISAITMNGGSILGDITSSYGAIAGITVQGGGSIKGNLTAQSMGAIKVTGGSITGDINAVTDIASITVDHGSLSGDVTVSDGTLDLLSVTSGSVAAGTTISASAGVGTIQVTTGDLNANVYSGRDINAITLTGAGSDLTGKVSADGDIGNVTVGGQVTSPAIRSGGTLGYLTVSGNIVGAIISTAGNIGHVVITGNLAGATVIAGYDIGPNCLIGGGDDNSYTGRKANAASIAELTIKGNFNGSYVGAGVNPGADKSFSGTGDDTFALGISRITKMTVANGFLNPGKGYLMAGTSIDPAAATPAKKAGLTVITGTGNWATPTGTSFGPGVGTQSITVGGLTLQLQGAGTGYFDAKSNRIVLKNTTGSSMLTLTYSGTGAYANPIGIVALGSSGLSSLKVIGGVKLGNVNIAGYVGTIDVGSVNAKSTWQLNGGAGTVTTKSLADVDVTAGNITSWTVNGNYTSSNAGAYSFTADAIGSFKVTGSMTTNVTTTVGDLGTLSLGNTSSSIDVAGSAGTITVGAFSGHLIVDHGDVATLTINGALTGTVSVEGGSVSTVTLNGDFSGASASFRTGGGIATFTANGNFGGLLSAGGNLNTLYVKKTFSGRVWSGGSITKVTVDGSTDSALVAASRNIGTAAIKGDLYGSYILAGFNPGDAGYDAARGGEAANLQIDALTNSAWRDSYNADESTGGTITLVTVGGDMGRRYNSTSGTYEFDGSTIAAGIDPGQDGCFGTTDDTVAGTGYVQKVVVEGNIFGNGKTGESYGVWAATDTPTVLYRHNQSFVSSGNAKVGVIQSVAGRLTVTNVDMGGNTITVYFSHMFNTSTITNSSFKIVASVDDAFGNSDDKNVTASFGHTLSFNVKDHSATFTLNKGLSWVNLNIGGNFEVMLDGDAVSDNRGQLLDGEYSAGFPSGNMVPGGDFAYEIQGSNSLAAEVPAYIWWFGCSPTSGGMLVGYYDAQTKYQNLIPGSATVQNAAVDNVIASSGDGIYQCDAFGYHGATKLATPGTGNIGDYAIYNGIDDSQTGTLVPDMSEVNPTGAHKDDSIADFMHTSRSSEGLDMGGSWPPEIASGIVGYIESKGYQAASQEEQWGTFTWKDFTSEIDAGRPVLLGVDAFGGGGADHSIIGIGYNNTNKTVEVYDTWSTTPVWISFEGVSFGHAMGIAEMITVNLA